jgi:hypothetical protein
VVWARRGIAVTACPKSCVTGDSLALIEEFWVRRRLGAMKLGELSARQVEAFSILEREYAAEINSGQ